MDIRYCPFCGTDLQGEPIPKKYREHYAPGVTHYSRLIGVTDLCLDRIVKWKCPDCEKEWGRNDFVTYDID